MHNFDPDQSPLSHSSLSAFRKAAEQLPTLQFVQPRSDRAWLSRDGLGPYMLTLQGGASLRLSAVAIEQLAALLDVRADLLARLRSMGGEESEDCRLLNKLLWHEGRDPSYGFRIRAVEDTIVGVLSSSYRALEVRRLTDLMERAEVSNRLRLLRFDIREGAYRLVFCFPGHDSQLLHRSERTGEVSWLPGAVLTNVEDGSHAVLIAPALVSPAGERVLPVVADAAGVTRKAHRGRDQEDEVIADVLSHSLAPFGELAERWRTLHRVQIEPGMARKFMDDAGLEFPSERMRAATIERLLRRKTSLYWLAYDISGALHGDSLYERARFEISLGELVWRRGQPAR